MKHVSTKTGEKFLLDRATLILSADGVTFYRTASGNIVKESGGVFEVSTLLELKPYAWQLPWAKVAELFPGADLEYPETI